MSSTTTTKSWHSRQNHEKFLLFLEIVWLNRRRSNKFEWKINATPIFSLFVWIYENAQQQQVSLHGSSPRIWKQQKEKSKRPLFPISNRRIEYSISIYKISINWFDRFCTADDSPTLSDRLLLYSRSVVVVVVIVQLLPGIDYRNSSYPSVSNPSVERWGTKKNNRAKRGSVVVLLPFRESRDGYVRASESWTCFVLF